MAEHSETSPAGGIRHSAWAEYLRRLHIQYPEFFPLPSLSPAQRKSLASQLMDIDFQKPLIACQAQDVKNYVFASGLLHIKKAFTNGSPHVICMNAYKLIEIYVGEHEEISALSQLKSHVLAIWLGYREPDNKRQSEIIEYMMELANAQGPLREQREIGLPRWRGQAVWLYYKGSQWELTRKYPKIIGLAKELGYTVVDLQLNGRISTRGLPPHNDAPDEIDEI